jgi:hypothetical protein
MIRPVYKYMFSNFKVKSIVFLKIIHFLFIFKTFKVTETEFCLRLQVESNQSGPIGRATTHQVSPEDGDII